jgi:flavin-dependent dehydrogenase
MLTKDRLAEFKRDPAQALVSFIADVPDAPPIRELRQASQIFGKLEMPNRIRGPIAPGLALVGDAALAIDPLWGIGCGWAFQSGEWLAESVAPALRGEEPLRRGLRRYRRRHARELRGHTLLIDDYATGRRFRALERTLYSAAARDLSTAMALERVGSRRARPGRTLARALPRAIAVNAHHALKAGSREHSNEGQDATSGRGLAPNAGRVAGHNGAEGGTVEKPQGRSSGGPAFSSPDDRVA